MRDDRLRQLGERRWSGHLNKGIHSFGHVRHCDGPVLRGGLRTDDLAVLDDVEYSAGKRIIGIIQFDESDLDLAVVLKNEGNVTFPVPYKCLFDLALVGALGVPLRRSYFLGLIAPNGHGIPGHIGEVSALSGHKSAGEVVVYAGNFNNCSGKALCRVVGVYLADAALGRSTRCFGCPRFASITESNSNCIASVAR